METETEAFLLRNDFALPLPFDRVPRANVWLLVTVTGLLLREMVGTGREGRRKKGGNSGVERIGCISLCGFP